MRQETLAGQQHPGPALREAAERALDRHPRRRASSGSTSPAGSLTRFVARRRRTRQPRRRPHLRAPRRRQGPAVGRHRRRPRPPGRREARASRTSRPSPCRSVEPQRRAGCARILEDDTGALWVGTSGGGLNRLDLANGRFERFRHDPNAPGSLAHDQVRALLQDADGRLWVGTGGGLDLFDSRPPHLRALPAGPAQPVEPRRRSRARRSPRTAAACSGWARAWAACTSGTR